MNLHDMLLKWNLEASKLEYPMLRFGDKAARLPEGLTPLQYACPVCKELYASEIEAMQCREQIYDEAGLLEGDIMVIPGSQFYQPPAKGFEYWCAFSIEGDPNADSHFDHNRQWFPYYVVTTIHPEPRNPHRCVVTVLTMFKGEFHGGWNPANGQGHNAMFHPHAGRSKQHSDIDSTWWTMERDGIPMGDRIICAEPSDKLREQAQDLAKLRISTRNLL